MVVKSVIKTILEKEKTGLLFLILIWILIQVTAFHFFKMRSSVDSELYITNAINITKGIFPQGREIFYISYSLFLSILYILDIDTQYGIFFNLVLGFLSVICVYKTTQLISKNTITAFLATLLYISWFKFQQWNLILYTDSAFSSLVIISSYLLLSRKKIILLFPILILTIFMRPTGIGFLFAILTYSLYVFRNRYRLTTTIKITIAIAVSITAIFLLNSVLSQFVDSFIDSYSKAEIIYPNIPLFISPATSLEIPSTTHEPLIRLIEFCIYNPVYMLKITTLKGALYLGHIKPYYSSLHNLYIILFLYPLYIFALIGFYHNKNNGSKTIIATFIGFQILTVSLTSENWDGRFLLPILPFVFILSAIGLKKSLLDTLFSKLKN